MTFPPSPRWGRGGSGDTSPGARRPLLSPPLNRKELNKKGTPSVVMRL